MAARERPFGTLYGKALFRLKINTLMEKASLREESFPEMRKIAIDKTFRRKDPSQKWRYGTFVSRKVFYPEDLSPSRFFLFLSGKELSSCAHYFSSKNDICPYFCKDLFLGARICV